MYLHDKIFKKMTYPEFYNADRIYKSVAVPIPEDFNTMWFDTSPLYNWDSPYTLWRENIKKCIDESIGINGNGIRYSMSKDDAIYWMKKIKNCYRPAILQNMYSIMAYGIGEQRDTDTDFYITDLNEDYTPNDFCGANVKALSKEFPLNPYNAYGYTYSDINTYEAMSRWGQVIISSSIENGREAIRSHFSMRMLYKCIICGYHYSRRVRENFFWDVFIKQRSHHNLCIRARESDSRILQNYVATYLQKMWMRCRYVPRYKMCEKIQLKNLEIETGAVLDE